MIGTFPDANFVFFAHGRIVFLHPPIPFATFFISDVFFYKLPAFERLFFKYFSSTREFKSFSYHKQNTRTTIHIVPLISNMSDASLNPNRYHGSFFSAQQIAFLILSFSFTQKPANEYH